MRPRIEDLEDRTAPAVFSVVSLGDDGSPGTLRWAIEQANGDSDPLSDIRFDLPGSGVRTIALQSSLPAITHPVRIDATENLDFQGTPFVEIDGSRAIDGFTILTQGSLVRGLILNRFGNSAIKIDGPDAVGNKISGNYIGTDASGLGTLGNWTGIEITNGASGTVIGGSLPGEGNVISGNRSSGIAMYGQNITGTTILGNLIGLGRDGSTPLGNANHGVEIAPTYDYRGYAGGPTETVIGGPNPWERNVISANGGSGVNAGSGITTIVGNYIGTDATGMMDRGNIGSGISNHFYAVIGGPTTQPGTGLGNVISGNGKGGTYSFANVTIDGLYASGTVQGNLIGLNASGTAAINPGTYHGIYFGGQGLQIGGSTPAERNIISGHSQFGIRANSAGTIQGNYIGTDITGSYAIANNKGIGTYAGSLIGGTQPGQGNLISGNTNIGVELGGGPNRLYGNRIGTNAAGTAALGNFRGVVAIRSGNIIGSGATGGGNLISGNRNDGILIDGNQGYGNRVQGNRIGTTWDGLSALPNGTSGVAINNGAYFNTIGTDGNGTEDATEGNLLSGNNTFGVWINGNGSNQNVVAGNVLGLDVTGARALPNNQGGVAIVGRASQNRVGGGGANAGNLISGNRGSGISVYGSGTNSNVIQGNRIGTDALGTFAIINQAAGVAVGIGAKNTIVGTNGDGVNDATEGNLVSGSYWEHIIIHDIETDGTVVAGNRIGTTADGMAAMVGGTAYVGVQVRYGARNTRIGTNGDGLSDDLEGNLISGITGPYGTFGHGVIIQTADWNGTLPINGRKTEGTIVAGNKIGTNLTGTAAIPSAENGISIFQGTPNTRIGTDGNGVGDLAERNLISGNLGSAISLNGVGTDGNLIAGNYLGTDVSGSYAIANRNFGIVVNGGAANNRIGGNRPLMGNLISGNGEAGIANDGTLSTVIQGNWIGVDATGSRALSNKVGIYNGWGSQGGWIGTDGDGVGDEAERNVISGNPVGAMYIQGAGTRNTVVAGNYIGTDATGSYGIPESSNVYIQDGAVGTRIGTDGSPDDFNVNERNVISGSRNTAIVVSHVATTGTVISGNFIGTNATGTGLIGNGLVLTGHGVMVYYGAQGTRVGTNGDGIADAVEGNVIAGSQGDGIFVGNPSWDGSLPSVPTSNTIIAGNRIGTDVTGRVAMGNRGVGVRLTQGVQSNRVGTDGNGVSDELEGNLVSGNLGSGIQLVSVNTVGNVVAGNRIGTNVDGTASLANRIDGIQLANGAANNRIGTNGDGISDELERNLVSGNNRIGMLLSATGPGNVIAGNYVGTDATGTIAVPNLQFGGIFVQAGSRGTILGTNGDGVGDAIEGNLISGNASDGLVLVSPGTSGNIVAGNRIGTNISGTQALPNGINGIKVYAGASNNRIGTNGDGVSDALERNLISGNLGNGVFLSDAGTSFNQISGNFIGTDVSGNAALGNGPVVFSYPQGSGVLLDGGASDNLIGGLGFPLGNLISGNKANGVFAQGTATTRNRIQGNRVGTNLAGDLPIGNNNNGITLENGAFANQIGGIEPGAGNLVSGNGQGIQIGWSSHENIVQGNTVGTNLQGTAAIPNTFNGISVSFGSSRNLIGGTLPGAGNLISGNNDDGIDLRLASYNTVQGNRIGINSLGTGPLGNRGNGILVREASANNVIGGDEPGAGNLVVANRRHGIWLHGSGTSFNRIQGNAVGTDWTGSLVMGNGQAGVQLSSGPTNNLIGGRSLGAQNWIAHQSLAGINLISDSTINNTLSLNTVFANQGGWIDLGGDGPTLNDPGDVDEGPNRKVNTPELSQVLPGPQTRIQGRIDSPGNGPFVVDVYSLGIDRDTSRPPRFLGSFTLTTDGWFDVELNSPTQTNEWIRAILTDAAGNTSELSTELVINQLPTANAGGPYSILEGESLQLNAGLSADFEGDPLTFAWDINGDGVFTDAFGAQPTLTLTDLMGLGLSDGPVSQWVRVKVSDPYHDPVESQPVALTIQNAPPVPSLGAFPATSPEGSTIGFTGTASDPSPGDEAAGLSLTWNILNSIGQVVATGLGSQFDFLPGDNGIFQVVLTATDKDGGVGQTSALVTITNVAPTLALNGSVVGVPFQPLEQSGLFFDPGFLDTWTVTLDPGDGTGPRPLTAGPDGSFAWTQVYTSPGTYPLTVTVQDDDGGIATVTKTITISPYLVRTNPFDPTKTDLLIGGSLGSDEIDIQPKGPNNRISAKVKTRGPGEFEWKEDFTGIQRILVYAGPGADDVKVHKNVQVDLWAWGGEGDDKISGGSGRNVVIGGGGNDRLEGGQNRDILIGSLGKDELNGAGEEDILLSGFTLWDERESALWGLQQEWNSNGSYATRTANLSVGTGSGLNGAVRLVGTGSQRTAFGDGQADEVKGSDGRDWFFAEMLGAFPDRLSDRKVDEDLVFLTM